MNACMIIRGDSYEYENLGILADIKNRFANRGVDLNIIEYYDGIELNLPGCDIIIDRTGDYLFNKSLSGKAKVVTNSNYLIEIANDKLRLYLWARVSNIPCMLTVPLSTGSLALPYIVKNKRTHRGEDQFVIKRVHDTVALELINRSSYICQPVNSDYGKTIRVYSTAATPVHTAVKITTVYSEDEGSCRNIEWVDSKSVPFEIVNMMNQIYDELYYTGISVQFTPHNGVWVIDEIEDCINFDELVSIEGYEEFVEDWITSCISAAQ